MDKKEARPGKGTVEASVMGEWMERGEFVHNLVTGRARQKKITEKAFSMGIPVSGYTYFILDIAVDLKAGAELPKGDEAPFKLKLEKAFDLAASEISAETGTDMKLLFSVDISLNITALLAVCGTADADTPAVKRLLSSILALNGDRSGYTLTVALGNPLQRLEEAAASAERVQEVIRNRHNRRLGIICYESEYQDKKQILDRISLPIGFLLFYVRSGQGAQANDEVRRIFEQFRKEESLSLDSARMVAIELAIAIFKANTAKDSELVSYLYFLNHIQRLNTITEMEEEIAQLAEYTAEHRESDENRRTLLVQQAVDYIHIHHPDKDLNLTKVANALKISIPYLTMLLREETGKTFSMHLMEIRIERAKQLLMSTDVSVADIASEVGYSSSQYFSTSFKRYTGKPPGEFRGPGRISKTGY